MADTTTKSIPDSSNLPSTGQQGETSTTSSVQSSSSSNPVQPIPPSNVQPQADPNVVSEGSKMTMSSTEEEKPAPQIIEKERVIVEKRGGGGGFSLKKCCCLGCALLLLLTCAIVAAFFFARESLMNLVDKWLNKGINVPAITTVDTTTINDALSNAVDSSDVVTIEVTQDEFNNIVKKNVSSTGDNTKVEVVGEFLVRESNLYIKISDPSLPWIVIHMTSDESGNSNLETVKMGPISFGKEQIESAMKNIANQEGQTNISEFNANSLIGYLLFGKDVSKADIKGIEFRKGILVVKVKGNEYPDTPPTVE